MNQKELTAILTSILVVGSLVFDLVMGSTSHLRLDLALCVHCRCKVVVWVSSASPTIQNHLVWRGLLLVALVEWHCGHGNALVAIQTVSICIAAYAFCWMPNRLLLRVFGAGPLQLLRTLVHAHLLLRSLFKFIITDGSLLGLLYHGPCTDYSPSRICLVVTLVLLVFCHAIHLLHSHRHAAHSHVKIHA